MNATSKKNKTKKLVGFHVRENECIWMKAGVVNFRICDNAYDCNTCRFDDAMQKAMKSGSGDKARWSDALKKQHAGDLRPCRHVLTGRIEPPKTCPNNYECNHCGFDQWLEETTVQLVNSPILTEASGYRIAEDHYYHMGHGWARVEHGGYVRVGFDDFSMKVFGTAHFVELPGIGEALDQNQLGWTFGRDGLRAGMMSPVSGTVLAVNHKVVECPEIIHESPYDGGWLFLIAPSALKKNVKKLYFGDEIVDWIGEESRKLMRLMGPEYDKLAATGGRPLDDFYGTYPEIGWDTLARSFLRT